MVKLTILASCTVRVSSRHPTSRRLLSSPIPYEDRPILGILPLHEALRTWYWDLSVEEHGIKVRRASPLRYHRPHHISKAHKQMHSPSLHRVGMLATCNMAFSGFGITLAYTQSQAACVGLLRGSNATAEGRIDRGNVIHPDHVLLLESTSPGAIYLTGPVKVQEQQNQRISAGKTMDKSR